MSRAQFVETVTVPLGPSGTLLPLQDIGATPYAVGTDGVRGAQVNAYTDRINDVPASLVTDVSGTISYFLDDGDYDIVFEDQQIPPRISSYSRAFRSEPLTVDTGWEPLDLATYTTVTAALGSDIPSARILGDFVYMKGSVKNTSGASLPATNVFAAVPSGFAPVGPDYVQPTIGWNQATGAAPDATQLIIHPDKTMFIRHTLAVNDILFFDGIVYSLI